MAPSKHTLEQKENLSVITRDSSDSPTEINQKVASVAIDWPKSLEGNGLKNISSCQSQCRRYIL